MGESFQIIDIILLAMIAGFIALRLRSVLGNKTGHERDPEELGKQKLKESAHLRLVTDDQDNNDGDAIAPIFETASLEKLSKTAKSHLETILTLEPEFNIDQFMDGVSKAYPMILEAFWLGKMDDVSVFLAEDVYAQFNDAVGAREKKGLTLDNRLIEIEDKAVSDILVEDRNADITVRIVSSIVAITRNKGGDVVDGDTSDTVEVVDVWTFRRELGSRDPNWLLVATSAG